MIDAALQGQEGKRRRIIFHHKDETEGGEGGQRRGCQQCTLGRHVALQPVTALSEAAERRAGRGIVVVRVYGPAE